MLLRDRFFLSSSAILSNMFFLCLGTCFIFNKVWNTRFDINIITDCSSNFIKAFSPYEPIYCFVHRINNVLKVCFFQQQQQNKIKQKFQSLSHNISRETQETLTNASLTVQADDSLESDCSKFRQEGQARNKSNESFSVVTSKLRKISTTTKSAQKLYVDSNKNNGISAVEL